MKPGEHDTAPRAGGDSQRPRAEPLVSVIMLAYNHGKYIAEAIEGVLAQQTTFPVELVIAEDCSPDDTLAVAERYRAMHPEQMRIVRPERNLGGTQNFWNAFVTSRARYIALCEGDDYWTSPRKLEAQVACMEGDATLSAVFTDFAIARGTDAGWSVSPRSGLAGVDLSGLRGRLKGLPPCGWLRTLTALYRRDVLADLHARRLPMADYPFADAFVLGQTMTAGRIELLPTVTAVYRESPSSATRSGDSARLAFALKMREFQENFDTFFPELGPLANNGLADVSVCRSAFMAGNITAFDSAFERLTRAETAIPMRLRIERFAIRHAWIRAAILRAVALRMRR